MRPFSDHRWGIVLAAGEGVRLKDYVRRTTGKELPKQYAALTGTRSMLRHTLDRAEDLLPVRNLLITVLADHRELASHDLTRQERNGMLAFPANRDTAPNVLVAALHVRAQDPDAMVVLIPSDHFILEEDRFLSYLESAFSFATANPDTGVLLGAVPDRPDPDYGWIEVSKDFARHDACRFHRVTSFVEKPDARKAKLLFDRGALWNSLVLVMRAETLISFFRKCTPALFRDAAHLVPYLRTPREESLTASWYQALPTLSFSKVILEREAHRLRVLRLDGVRWCDWGKGERVNLSLATLSH